MGKRDTKKNKIRKRLSKVQAKRKRRHSKILKLENHRRKRRGQVTKEQERKDTKQTRANIVADAKKQPKRKRHNKGTED